MIPFDFTRPWFLFALLALVPVFWLARSTRLRLSRGRFLTSLTARTLAVLSLALSLAGFRFVRTSDDLAVLFVLDRSRSVTAEDGKRALDWIVEASKAAGAREQVGLVVFGREASVEVSPGPKLEVDKIHSVVSPEGTDLARALRLALAACPENAQKRIVLLTDGNQNAGDALQEALAARGRGAEVWTVALGAEARAEVRVDRVLTPALLTPKEPYEITAIVTATEDCEATFRILKNRVPMAPVKRKLKKGTWPVTFASKVQESEAGMSLDFEVLVSVGEASDTWRENNVGRAHARVQGPSRVLYLEGREGEDENLAACLRDAGIAVEVRGPAGAPLTLAEMDAFDGIILCDVHARQLSRGQQEALRQYVHDLGGGLVMIGGESSFGGGTWQRTPVEEALPVFMDVRQVKHKAALAVVIIIDSSGSMSAKTADGRTKLELAGEAAAEVVNVLNPRDEVAVATVDTETDWLVRMGPIGDRESTRQKIQSLKQGGGGIFCNVGLKAAFEEMSVATSAMKHVILFSDSSDSENKDGCAEMVEAAAQAGITLSVVAIGKPTDKDAAWLEQMAQLGGGRYYITDDALDLPRIFSEETVLAARSVIVEEEFMPVLVRPGQLLEGVDWDTMPALQGYVASVPKDQAEVHMEAMDGDPLLSKWHYGLGRSLAFNSDAKPRWAKSWIAWPGYRTLWPQLLRWTMRRGDPAAFTVATTLSGGTAHLTVDAVATSGRFRDFLKLRAFVAGPNGSFQAPLRQTGPGRYEADFGAADAGSWFVTIAEHENEAWSPRTSVPILIPYPAEYRTSSPDRALLKRIAEMTGGQVAALGPLPDLFRHTASAARIPRDVWRLLLSLALAMLMFDVAARRLGIPESWRQRRRAVFKEAAEAPAEPVVAHLRDVKAHVPMPHHTDAPPGSFASPARPGTPPPAVPAKEDGGYLDRLKAAKKRAQK